ncbi:MAG TPA: hypothetical protein VH062_08565 [Polyangiaceae bacterium]|jgi:hypothetical protein|nr:hypothetical protein [Polyangiaceae bacterium]
MRRFLFALALTAGCSSLPRPTILAEVDRTREAAAVKQAAALAPQAYLVAEKLRRDAEDTYDKGDRAGSELLGEQALAAYAHADALARLARAEQRLDAASKKLALEGHDFATIDEEQRRIAAEADDLETRVRVARDAVPLAPSEPASVDREGARLAAARALSTEARLLCVAAQMLSAQIAGPADAFKALDELDAELDKHPVHPPIDAAIRLRSTCLTALTEARRPTAQAAPESGAADALLDELGKASLEPSRDDRGVSVVVRNAFDGASLAAPARERLVALGQVSKAHPAFPLLVVVHGAHGRAVDADTEHATAAAEALRAAGASRVEAKAVGDTLPIAIPGRDATRNERVEVVFVSPAR